MLPLGYHEPVQILYHSAWSLTPQTSSPYRVDSLVASSALSVKALTRSLVSRFLFAYQLGCPQEHSTFVYAFRACFEGKLRYQSWNESD